MRISGRLGKCRLFANVRQSENDNYGGLQLGFTSYDTDSDGRETYATSYCEWGGRSDHIYDLLSGPVGAPEEIRYVDEATDDVAYVGTVKQNERATAKGQSSTQPQLKVA